MRADAARNRPLARFYGDAYKYLFIYYLLNIYLHPV